MARTIFQGCFRDKARSLFNLLSVSALVLARRLIGKPLVAGWTVQFEIGTLFWRRQFNHALALENVADSRAYFDSLYMVLDDRLDVEIRPSEEGEPPGLWFIPRSRASDITVLYLHGGGYAFYAAVTRHFIALLAATLRMPIFAPDYRLTPEHPHPAQIEDGLAAYEFLLRRGIDARRLVVCGDSAGGHLMLMLLVRLREQSLAQPAIGIGLSPWTDTGRRGASQFGNDRYDMVQGYMTLRFAAWLKGGQPLSDEELSPIHQDFRGTAPIYLQAGGKEILVDMIRDFAATLQTQGARVRLDVWQHMTHEFHAYGEHLPQSKEALMLIGRAVAWATERCAPCPAVVTGTEVDCLRKEVAEEPRN